MGPGRSLSFSTRDCPTRKRRVEGRAKPEPSNAASQCDGTAVRSALLDFLELGVDDVFVVAPLGRFRMLAAGRARAAASRTRAAACRRLLRRLRLGIHLLAELLARLQERF